VPAPDVPPFIAVPPVPETAPPVPSALPPLPLVAPTPPLPAEEPASVRPVALPDPA
jgi:hypothetical protein